MTMRAHHLVVLSLASLLLSRTARAEVYTSTSDVRACVPRDDGTTLAATTGGLAIVSGGKVTRTLTALDGLPDTKTNALLVDSGDVWVGTDRGLALLRVASGQLSVVRTLGSSPVRALAVMGGTIYVGTFGDGVQKLASESGPLLALPFVGATVTAPRKRISSLAIFDGSLYAGTTGGGLLRVVDGKLQAVGGEVPSTISALGLHDNRLYIGAIEGFWSMGKNELRREGDKDVRAIASMGGELFAGSYGAGVMHPGKGGLVAVASVPKAASLVSALGSRGSVRCLGTANGLYVSSGSSGSTWSEIAMSGPPSNDVTAIARDGDRLWVGTYDKGLSTLENGVFKKVVDPNLDERINGLAPQLIDGKLRMWVATTRGLDLLGGKTTVHYNEG
jgi:ligand-binding sensor domain-containing protein